MCKENYMYTNWLKDGSQLLHSITADLFWDTIQLVNNFTGYAGLSTKPLGCYRV